MQCVLNLNKKEIETWDEKRREYSGKEKEKEKEKRKGKKMKMKVGASKGTKHKHTLQGIFAFGNKDADKK